MARRGEVSMSSASSQKLALQSEARKLQAAVLCGAFQVRASVAVLGLLLTIVSSHLHAQGSLGKIYGSITDSSGGSVAGARVTVTDVQRGAGRIMTTDIAGAFSAPNLTPGSYAVRVEFQGFKTVERKDIALEVGQELRVDLSLDPGQQTQ